MKTAKYPERADRLKRFFKSFKIRNVDAAERMGYERATFLSQLLNKNSTITMDMAHRIVSAYPMLNVNWLLFGDGEMLNSSNSVVNEPVPKYEKLSPFEQIDRMMEQYEIRINNLEEKVKVLQQRVDDLMK